MELHVTFLVTWHFVEAVFWSVSQSTILAKPHCMQHKQTLLETQVDESSGGLDVGTRINDMGCWPATSPRAVLAASPRVGDQACAVSDPDVLLKRSL